MWTRGLFRHDTLRAEESGRVVSWTVWHPGEGNSDRQDVLGDRASQGFEEYLEAQDGWISDEDRRVACDRRGGDRVKPKVDQERLHKHIKLCRRNLRSNRVQCCATCPFEDFVVAHSPDLKGLFEAKRKRI